jgi:hypothetical protein
MKYFLGILFLTIISCNRPIIENSYPIYPQIIDSLGIQNLYDIGKWKLYTLNCLDSIEVIKDKEKISFSKLDIIIDTLIFNDNVIEINYKFHSNKINNIENYINHRNFIRGIGFYNKTDSIVYFSMNSHLRYKYEYRITDSIKRIKMTKELPLEFRKKTSLFLYDPLQPEVLEFIKKNKNELNPSFRNEAINKGIIYFVPASCPQL